MKITDIERPVFLKNDNSIEIEGFLSETDFNGILILLREPNSESAKEFWFKNVINDIDGDYFNSLEQKGKSAATKYKNCLEKCLIQFENIEKFALNECAYMNLRPNSGESKASSKYKEILRDLSDKHERWESIESLSPTIIFTCNDIYEKLKIIMNCKTEYIDNGIKYKNKTLRYFESKIKGKDCVVYEIYHPSARKSILDIPK